MKNINEKKARKYLINYCMDHASLTEDIDYLPDSERLKAYTEAVNNASIADVMESLLNEYGVTVEELRKQGILS